MIEELSQALIEFYRHVIECLAQIWTDLLSSNVYFWPRVVFFGLMAILIVVELFHLAVQRFSKS